MKPEPIYKEIGTIIRSRRRSVDKPQAALASQLGISRATLANIETGRQRILVHQLYGIARALSVRPADLLPPPRDDDLVVDIAALRFQGNLNAEQMKQVANLIGPIEQHAPAPKDEIDAETAKRKPGSRGTKASR